ncbi:MAG: LytTR family transcriptional regulator DNA-binding domain-containing protein, partial [Burkholderiales bacterium]|nr:LytTR family transcriptional regulator DNA-binding domain-containing protein [Burkholderiales bacterium]
RIDRAPSPPPASPPHHRARSDVAIVQLDAARRVIGMNDFARRVLPVERMQPFDRMVLSFHPERSQPKGEFLLDRAGACPAANPLPMTMIINIPERVLLIKVSRMTDGAGDPVAYVLVFHDVTETVAVEPVPGAPRDARRRLHKIPTAQGSQILFVDAEQVLRVHSDGHYTRVVTADGERFCNLGIGDLEARLDPERFFRVHRTHILNLDAVRELVRADGRLAVRLRGDATEIPVSRTAAAGLLERLGLAASAVRAV